jgi:ElaB/YqjD/DUF883 family membrane-anchored ribosome-binding protein
MSPDDDRAPATSDPEALRQDIEATRQQLADTVEALSYKADVKGRARDKARELREQAAERAQQVREQAAERAQQVRKQAVSAIPHSPDEARNQARQAARVARERPTVVIGVLAVLIALIVLGRLRGRRTCR